MSKRHSRKYSSSPSDNEKRKKRKGFRGENTDSDGSDYKSSRKGGRRREEVRDEIMERGNREDKDRESSLDRKESKRSSELYGHRGYTKESARDNNRRRENSGGKRSQRFNPSRRIRSRSKSRARSSRNRRRSRSSRSPKLRKRSRSRSKNRKRNRKERSRSHSKSKDKIKRKSKYKSSSRSKSKEISSKKSRYESDEMNSNKAKRDDDKKISDKMTDTISNYVEKPENIDKNETQENLNINNEKQENLDSSVEKRDSDKYDEESKIIEDGRTDKSSSLTILKAEKKDIINFLDEESFNFLGKTSSDNDEKFFPIEEDKKLKLKEEKDDQIQNNNCIFEKKTLEPPHFDAKADEESVFRGSSKEKSSNDHFDTKADKESVFRGSSKEKSSNDHFDTKADEESVFRGSSKEKSSNDHFDTKSDEESVFRGSPKEKSSNDHFDTKADEESVFRGSSKEKSTTDHFDTKTDEESVFRGSSKEKSSNDHFDTKTDEESVFRGSSKEKSSNDHFDTKADEGSVFRGPSKEKSSNDTENNKPYKGRSCSPVDSETKIKKDENKFEIDNKDELSDKANIYELQKMKEQLQRALDIEDNQGELNLEHRSKDEAACSKNTEKGDLNVELPDKDQFQDKELKKGIDIDKRNCFPHKDKDNSSEITEPLAHEPYQTKANDGLSVQSDDLEEGEITTYRVPKQSDANGYNQKDCIDPIKKKSTSSENILKSPRHKGKKRDSEDRNSDFHKTKIKKSVNKERGNSPKYMETNFHFNVEKSSSQKSKDKSFLSDKVVGLDTSHLGKRNWKDEEFVRKSSARRNISKYEEDIEQRKKENYRENKDIQYELPTQLIKKPVLDPLSTRTGGAYIPPARLKMMQDEIKDKSSPAFQRLSWEALKKSINGLVNKINVSNLAIIVKELFKENIIRGRGILCRALMQAQAFSPTFTHVYGALVAVINTKFPQIGELLLHRLIMQLRRGIKRNDKNFCIASCKFIAHLVNQQVVHEVVALEILTMLLEKAKDIMDDSETGEKSRQSSVELSIVFLKECGMMLTELTPKGLIIIMETLRNILHEGKLDPRYKYMIEVLMAIKKENFKDFPSVIKELQLVEEEDQFTHIIELDGKLNTQDILNVFKLDPDFEENENKYKELKANILSESDSEDDDNESGAEGDTEDSDSEEEKSDTEKEENPIFDRTETNSIAFRRTVYLTIQSSLDVDECAHKLLKGEIKPGWEEELCNMIIDCCAQQRTYIKFYGLLAQRFCMINKIYQEPFESIFRDAYETCHRLEIEKLRNVAKLFGHLLFSDAISWEVMSCIHLNQDETTSSSRVFLKILFEDLADFMGLCKLNERLREPTLSHAFEGLLPRDNPANTRFAINFFTTIGLGGLTDDLREFLRSQPKPTAVVAPVPHAQKDNSGNSSSTSSSSSESSSSSSSSDTESDSPSDSSSSDKSSSSSNNSSNSNGGSSSSSSTSSSSSSSSSGSSNSSTSNSSSGSSSSSSSSEESLKDSKGSKLKKKKKVTKSRSSRDKQTKRKNIEPVRKKREEKYLVSHDRKKKKHDHHVSKGLSYNKA